VGGERRYPVAGIQSRALRARLRMLQRPYGAQESDCISPLRDIPATGYRLSPLSNVAAGVRLTFVADAAIKVKRALGAPPVSSEVPA
jgi:hypothetical protein